MKSNTPQYPSADDIVCRRLEFASNGIQEYSPVGLAHSSAFNDAKAEAVFGSSIQKEQQEKAQLIANSSVTNFINRRENANAATHLHEEAETASVLPYDLLESESTGDPSDIRTARSESISRLVFDFSDTEGNEQYLNFCLLGCEDNQDSYSTGTESEEETSTTQDSRTTELGQKDDTNPIGGFSTVRLASDQLIESPDQREAIFDTGLPPSPREDGIMCTAALLHREKGICRNNIKTDHTSSQLSDLVPVPNTVLELLGEINDQIAYEEQESCPPSMTMSSPDSISPATESTWLNSTPPGSPEYLLASTCRNHDENDVFYDSQTGQFGSCDISTPTAAHRNRRRRNFSANFPFSPLNKPFLPPRDLKPKENVFLFRANTPFKKNLPIPTPHRHKISFGLPIDVLSGSAQPARRSPHRPTTLPASLLASPDSQTAIRQAESELEYKHRHTFIGTASLDDFLEALETSSNYTTSRRQIAKAFITLSSHEQIYARQASSRPEGWELVSRVTQDVTNIDFIAQAHIKLGSIPLRGFLELIPFDERDEVRVVRVVEAFCAACHLDREAGNGAGSKARAFRSWAVMQKESV